MKAVVFALCFLVGSLFVGCALTVLSIAIRGK